MHFFEKKLVMLGKIKSLRVFEFFLLFRKYTNKKISFLTTMEQ